MFWIIIVVGVVLYFVLRGRRDRPEQLGAAHRPLTTGALEPHTFPCPYAKCQSCGGSGEGMKQDWDGLRAVKWTCGYCGALAGVQELKDEELPPSARRRLGLDAPPMAQGGMPMQPGGFRTGGGMGDLLTGMMIGSMMGGGSSHDRSGSDDGGWGSGDSGGGSDWGDSSGGSDWGDSGGSDWGDSGGDSGGGDSGGDW